MVSRCGIDASLAEAIKICYSFQQLYAESLAQGIEKLTRLALDSMHGNRA